MRSQRRSPVRSTQSGSNTAEDGAPGPKSARDWTALRPLASQMIDRRTPWACAGVLSSLRAASSQPSAWSATWVQPASVQIRGGGSRGLAEGSLVEDPTRARDDVLVIRTVLLGGCQHIREARRERLPGHRLDTPPTREAGVPGRLARTTRGPGMTPRGGFSAIATQARHRPWSRRSWTMRPPKDGRSRSNVRACLRSGACTAPGCQRCRGCSAGASTSIPQPRGAIWRYPGAMTPSTLSQPANAVGSRPRTPGRAT